MIGNTIKKIWKSLALTLARINTYALLFIVFFLTIAPLGIFFRALGKSILRTPPGETLWMKKDGASALDKPF